ncbi:MAG: UDP-N-acetylmuramoyl-L-alanine--D-glutamate ligase [Eubacterium sp.]|nr:UDP-N-acetylmuramoyl-L-alanine--D-glutamate ligase [Eubacterium sp.]
MSNDTYKNTLIIGAGKSGISSAALLLRNGAKASLFDGNTDLNPDDIRARSLTLKDSGIPVFLGDITSEELSAFDRVVVSPGVPLTEPIVVKCREAGLPIISEIELAGLYAKGRIIGITGTNGKTTTTMLTGEIMKSAFDDVYVVGNIGDPFTDIADRTTDESVCVIELSSFQLETVEKFHANVSAILNLTPDHLDRHLTMENYDKAKQRITRGQSKSEYCVLNADDPYTSKFASSGLCPATPLLFSCVEKQENGAYLSGNDIMVSFEGKEEKLMDSKDMNLVGLCNIQNVMAAALIGLASGIPAEKIADCVRKFKAVSHRIEYSGTKRGVRFYNDSKGTNPDSAIQGIRAMDAPTCLIGGGYDKKIPFDEWVKCFDGKVKKLVLLGQTAQQIAQTCDKYGFKDYCFADSLEEAIDICYAAAEDGECVLLSPACASWGMFKNYEVRGDLFKEYVASLEE